MTATLGTVSSAVVKVPITLNPAASFSISGADIASTAEAEQHAKFRADYSKGPGAPVWGTPLACAGELGATAVIFAGTLGRN